MSRQEKSITDHGSRITARRRRKLFMFLTLLILLILTQVVVLGWGPETVFFVTWLLVALTVRHDSRLSAALGLAFLVISLFLLIAGKEDVAEQAANYGYYFLATGVLVQLEEMLLERYDWLDRKLDLSGVWRPVGQALRRPWSAGVGALGRLQAAADRNELVRTVQIVGTIGLAAVFFTAAFSGAPVSIVLPLVGGAILFPFLVWGLRLALRALGPAWLVRALLALIVLPLTALEMVWLHNLVTADRLARMETAYDFVERLDEAERTSPAPEGETIEARAWTIGEVPKRVLYQHPALSGASRLAYTVDVGKGSVLAFDVAMAPESWEQPGDGVAFAVYVESEAGARQLFSTYVDPKQDEAARRWHPHDVDLSDYAGNTVTLIFETGSGPANDFGFDWAGWGAPRLLEP
jgi:hypothetical protein